MSTDTPAGLCGSCRHVRRIENRRGSVFFLCRRAQDDDRFSRYPRIPVLRCPGFEKAPDVATNEDPTAPSGERKTDGTRASEPGPSRPGER